MTLSISQLAVMSRLLDEALPLDEAARLRWLDALGAEHQDVAEALRRALLTANENTDGARFLTLPKLAFRQENPSGSEIGLEAGMLFGPYELIRPLGSGGMAEVWLAKRADGAFNREVALKLPLLTRLRRDLGPRFAREREILAGLSHPNIARLFDAGFAKDGQPYLALEYVVGTTLTAYCDQHHLMLRERLELFRQTLSAVQYAHTHLVIHRDLKPSNVLVTEAGQVQLLDFGIAKLLSEGEAKETELTRISGRALTLDYAAPEQIAGAPITTAADVYALGVILYEILTGERPYRLRRDTRAALEETILQVDPVPPSCAALGETAATARGATTKKLSRALKGDLDVITIKALKKSPKERYQTVSALDEDIARFLNGRVILAQPDSIAYRANKFARRHWVAIAMVSVLFLTLAGGLAATSYEAQVASAQRDAALQAQLRSLTQAADARLQDGDILGAQGIILEVLPHRESGRPYAPEALNVFQESRAADTQYLVLGGHTGAVYTAAFSADGRSIVTASSDKTARVWSALTGREVRQLRGHADIVESAAFSPDGRRIVTASGDKTARIWDAVTGESVMQLVGHEGKVVFAAFSPEGQRIVTASGDNTAVIWDAVTGQRLVQLIGHTDSVAYAEFSPDGRRVATASLDRTARIWDASTGRLVVTLRGHEHSVNSAAFSPDGNRVATTSSDKTAAIWDAKTGSPLVTLRGHEHGVYDARFSPDGEHLATASADGTIRIWDVHTGRQLLLIRASTGAVYAVAYSSDGNSLLTASVDATARVWALGINRELEQLRGHTQLVNTAAFSPDGSRILTASNDQTARIWDTTTGRERIQLHGDMERVYSAAFSPDGRQVVTGSSDGTARIWDVETGRQLLLIRGQAATVYDAAFSPDGRRIVTTALWDRTACIWSATTGQKLVVLVGHTGYVTSAAFSPDGRKVVTAARDGTARIWDSFTGRTIMSLRGHADNLVSADFSPDGRRIVTASNDKTARIWDSGNGRQLLVLSGHRDTVESAAFSPDGARIVTASNDKTVRLWDAATGQQLEVMSGHSDTVESAKFSPDGRRIVSASDDKTVRLWDAVVSGLDVQIAWAAAAQFDPPSTAQRFQLGLPAPANTRSWGTNQTPCDQAAAAPYDPDRRAPGAMSSQIVPDLAIAACTLDNTGAKNDARSLYQQGRALVARGDFAGAKRDFEHALARGYRSAGVDLGLLLSRTDAGMFDFPRATGLYEQAWREGVTIAAFELGNLYEYGVSRGVGEREYSLAPDQVRAWSWYEKAAHAGEPNALARLAEREDSAALLEENLAKKNSLQLESFKYYAAAAERARIEDWPDDAWRTWRYRRASLARRFAREGRMQEVAGAYGEVRSRYARSPTVSERLASLLHRTTND